MHKVLVVLQTRSQIKREEWGSRRQCLLSQRNLQWNWPQLS